MRNKKAYNSVGRVPVLQTGCHRFESGWAYINKKTIRFLRIRKKKIVDNP